MTIFLDLVFCITALILFLFLIVERIKNRNEKYLLMYQLEERDRDISRYEPKDDDGENTKSYDSSPDDEGSEQEKRDRFNNSGADEGRVVGMFVRKQPSLKYPGSQYDRIRQRRAIGQIRSDLDDMK